MNDYWEEKHEEQEERRLMLALKKIYDELVAIHALLLPKANSLKVQFGGIMPLLVGSSSTATLTVLDAAGQPMPYDLAANPPAWTADPTASIAPGTSPNDEVFTGVSAGPCNWSVTVPGVANPMASGTFDVSEAAGVATSVVVSFNPPVDATATPK